MSNTNYGSIRNNKLVEMTHWLDRCPNTQFESQYGWVHNWDWLEFEAERVGGTVCRRIFVEGGRKIERRCVKIKRSQCQFINKYREVDPSVMLDCGTEL
jgi:hypothetical protein